MKKIFLLLVVLLSCSYSYSQSKINITVHHDAKLLLIGDDKGNDAITFNILVKAEFPIKEYMSSTLFAYPVIEYADLIGGNYQRYGAGIGYNIHDVFRNFDLGISVDYGNLKRGSAYDGFSANLNGEVAYSITDRLKVSYVYQVGERPDLKALYNSKTSFIGSGFIGVKFSL
ncbi:hypothetical protein GCM10011416_10970 [Polaribacter pacificus]|uniref:Outer membrane protein beta-barrel domain-containing protein n=1 Tax=Polaribacter pacificus TaxID=1775173 RepID=A0A917HYX4_9FLAO|nr:hypothetical protein [Polaribacter pacificus]GGG95276.1 hypothetical protein GCM10011416_10970 [Polaribacter pacificus]